MTLLALDGGLEADALDFQLLDKAFADALDHIIDDGAAQAVQGPGLGVLALAADDDAAAVEFGGGAAGQVKIQLALGAFDEDTFGP